MISARDDAAAGSSGAAGSVAAAGEDRLVAAVLARLSRRSPAWLSVPPGDDAAVLASFGPGGLVVSTDTLVEGRDFRLSTSSGTDVGVKAAAQNFADIAAMGARPVALLVSLAVPGRAPMTWVEGLSEGLELECARARASVVGGDVSDAGEIVVTGTALGTMDGLDPVLRSGAEPGDVVALAGPTGPSAAGLALLEAGIPAAGLSPGEHRLVGAHRRPVPPYEAGPAAARAGAGALIDTSDGLVRDAIRLARASGVTIDLDPSALDPDRDLLAAATRLGVDEAGTLAREWVLTGGEDHALLACFPPGAALPPPYRPIGVVRGRRMDGAGDDVQLLLAGRPWTGPTGWTHFA